MAGPESSSSHEAAGAVCVNCARTAQVAKAAPAIGDLEEYVRVAYTLLAPVMQDFGCEGEAGMSRLSGQAICDLVEAARAQLHLAGEALGMWGAEDDVCFADRDVAP